MSVIAAWDQTIFSHLYMLAYVNRWLDYVFIFLADYLPLFLVLEALYFILKIPDWRRRWFAFAEASLAVILSRAVFVEIIQFFYNRPRPFLVLPIAPLINHNATAAFPSGHASFFFALAFAMFFYNRRQGWVIFAGALIMGLARIISGVHWPADILGGLVVGSASAAIAHFLLRPLARGSRDK